MYATLLLTALVLGLAPLRPAAAQDTPGDRPDIVGTVSVVADKGGWTEHIEATVRFAFQETFLNTHTYTLAGGEVTWSAVDKPEIDQCTYTGGPLTIAIDPSRHFGRLNVTPLTGTYSGSAHLEYQVDLRRAVMQRCPTGTPTYTHGTQLQFFTTQSQRLDTTGTRMRDSLRIRHEGWTTYRWDLRYETAEQKLVVDIPAYETWLPEPGLDEYFPGGLLRVEAVVLNADGSAPDVLPESFTFALEGTSHEPGIALNYPLREHALATPDLRFLSVPNEIEMAADSQQVTVGPVAAGSRHGEAKIGSYDGGAFATLRVTARLRDGRTLTGRLEAWGGLEAIPLPRRTLPSKIGEAYREAKASLGLGDADDADAEPAGDGHAGDGLTHYEEYRGFLNGAVYTRTDPRRKTILVRDDLGGAIKAGIALYRRITGLEVLGDLTAQECDTLRVVNANHDQGDHVVDQHALWIRYTGRPQGLAVSDLDAPATPKHIRHIELPTMEAGVVTYRRGGRLLRSNPLASMVAHELLHGSNVWHHGDLDLGQVFWSIDRKPDSTAIYDADRYPVVLEDAVLPVQPRRESGERFLPVWVSRIVNRPQVAALAVPWVAVEHGQHSGHENCVMRYAAAWFYTRQPGDAARFEAPDVEVTGMRFCKAPDGTGVNDPGREPQYRHGDATKGRCQEQLCVNDRYH